MSFVFHIFFSFSPIVNFCNELSHSITYSLEVILKYAELNHFEFEHKNSGSLGTRTILLVFPALVSLQDPSVDVKKTDQIFHL